MIRRLAILATALVVAGAWFVVTAPDGGAVSKLDTAWWWQAEPTTGAVPAPPTVPDGGLWVSSNAAGPQSISAIRITLDPGDATPTLSLDVHQSVPPNDAELLAYPTSTAFAAGPAQSWSTKPTYDATGPRAIASLSSDGKKMTFDLSGLVTGDTLSVVIVPNAAAAAPPPPLPAPPASPAPTFDVTFEKPGPANVQVTSGAAAQPDDTAPVASAAPAPTEDATPLPSDSFSAAVPTGLSAPLPLVASTPTPARSSPRVAFNSVPRSFVPTSAKRSFGDSAAIAVMLGIVLLWVARDTATSGGPRRARLSLYDAPKPAAALAANRTGSPPALH